MTTRLEAGAAIVDIDPENGCRIASLLVDDIEVLREGPKFGSFPMVPWCGRIDQGRFQAGGTTYQMPLNAPPHASHGTGRDVPWRRLPATGDPALTAVFAYRLGDPWPYEGTVTQQFELAEDGGALTVTLGVETAGVSFPAQAGWHPWFRRSLGLGGEVQIAFDPAWQEERGADHLPTGERIEPLPGPWDDCFGMPYGVDVTLTWPGALELKVSSREEWVVVYDEQAEAVCVEPQTGPPNGLNTLPRLVTPIDPLEASMTWTWRRLAG
ncbi:aldose 1-epimerase [Streptomyces sp. NPDC051940]|uniref:aldose epimerase family protein n=1 Tax=Streptomyces sp. NPDC051940 TaxID=3155675 RepID=UPI00344281C0